MFHIIDRSLIHFFSAMGVVSSVFFIIRWVRRRYHTNGWLPPNVGGQLVLAAVVTFAGSTLREARDVEHGQTVAKAVFDYGTWLAGVSVGAWAIYKMIWMNWEE